MIQGLAQATTPAPVTPPRDEAPTQDVDPVLEVDALIRDYRDGHKQPPHVELPPIPAGVHPATVENWKAVRRFFTIVAGLRVLNELPDDVLFCSDWAASHITAFGHPIQGKTVARILRKMCATGVLEFAGEYKHPTWPKPGYLYRPGVLARSPEVARHRVDQPPVERVDDPLVARAVRAVGDRPLDAAGNGASDGGGGFHA